MTEQKTIATRRIREILGQVMDPEIPVLSVLDLGIIRDILTTSPLVENSPSTHFQKEPQVEVVITPTYSGCPAMHVIAMNIRMQLLQNGFNNIKITQQLSPAWTTDWITDIGKDKLKAYGIAPPQSTGSNRNNNNLFIAELNIECPQCHGRSTKLLSQFGSTACKALYQCNNCGEPFDYFKCH